MITMEDTGDTEESTEGRAPEVCALPHWRRLAKTGERPEVSDDVEEITQNY